MTTKESDYNAGVTAYLIRQYNDQTSIDTLEVLVNLPTNWFVSNTTVNLKAWDSSNNEIEQFARTETLATSGSNWTTGPIPVDTNTSGGPIRVHKWTTEVEVQYQLNVSVNICAF